MTARVWPTWLTVFGIVLATALGFHAMTHGFQAVTRDGGRQLDLVRSPRSMPAVALVDSHGAHTDLQSLARRRPITVVTLVYTQCTSLCLLTASSEAFLQTRLREAGLQDRVQLLTISFDPARDTPDALAQYARRVRADAGLWTIATVAEPSQLDELLDAFGVVVVPDGTGEYIHNGALFVMDRNGRLVDALDVDAAEVANARVSMLAGAP